MSHSEYIFDGYAHRRYQEELDGWRNKIPKASDYPVMSIVSDINRLFNDLCEAKAKIWELEQRLKHYEK